jgi:hypothetical protein
VNQGWEFAFCATPDRLDISAYTGNGANFGLLNVPGLQTLSLVKESNEANAGSPQSTNAVAPQTVASEACPSTAACGGDPTGSWTSTSICLEAPSPPTSPGQPCDDLVYLPPDDGGQNQSQIEYLNLPLGPGIVSTPANVSLQADGTYTTVALTEVVNQAQFASYCLTAWGANPSCNDLQTQFQQSFLARPNWQNFACSAPDAGGCDCSYTYLSSVADMGTWSVDGTTLTLTSALAPWDVSQFTFCKTAGGLQMTTIPGSTLIGLGPGTMTLVPAP